MHHTADMQLTDIPFGITDWSTVEPTVHPGTSGTATWRTRHFGDVRVRMVETGFDTHAVDTPADLALVEQSMRSDPLLGSY